VTIIGPGLIEIFGLEMATELIPYKGLSLYLGYLTVPIVQLIVSRFWTYQQILLFFLGFTGISLMLSCYFMRRVRYVRYSSPEKARLRQ
jgi:hypothetical protein